jgi:hypothetical protein
MGRRFHHTRIYQRDSFLRAIYPVANFEDVEDQAGSIDLGAIL